MFRSSGSTASAVRPDGDRPGDPVGREHMARFLERTGDFRIVRRLRPPVPLTLVTDSATDVGVYVDVETTGLDAASHEIIEIGIVPFSYTREGDISTAYAGYSGLRQPSKPVPAEIVALTGIDDAMLKGRSIPPGDIVRLVSRASLVVAHNAAFDRGFLERLFPAFRDLPWACSMADVPWKEEGLRQTSLEALAASFGFFYGGHRAVDDCHAGVEILGRRLPRSGDTVLRALLERVRRPTFRVWALGAPFASKDVLKSHGYRWNDGGNGGPRAWYRDVEEVGVEGERCFLVETVFRRSVEVTIVEIGAKDRHSERSWEVPHAR